MKLFVNNAGPDCVNEALNCGKYVIDIRCINFIKLTLKKLSAAVEQQFNSQQIFEGPWSNQFALHVETFLGM